MTKKIVKVQYKQDIFGYSGREYTYYTDMPLKVGDIVLAPTKYGESRARVSAVNVRDAECASIPHLMRTIPAQELICEEETKEQIDLLAALETAGGDAELLF